MKRPRIIFSFCLAALFAFALQAAAASPSLSSYGAPPLAGGQRTSGDPFFEQYATRGQAFAHCPDYTPASPAPKATPRKRSRSPVKKSSTPKKTAVTPAPSLESLLGADPLCPPGCVPASGTVSSAGTSERAPAGALPPAAPRIGSRSVPDSSPQTPSAAEQPATAAAPAMVPTVPPQAPTPAPSAMPMTPTAGPPPETAPMPQQPMPPSVQAEPAAPATGIPAPSAANLGQFSGSQPSPQFVPPIVTMP